MVEGDRFTPGGEEVGVVGRLRHVLMPFVAEALCHDVTYRLEGADNQFFIRHPLLACPRAPAFTVRLCVDLTKDHAFSRLCPACCLAQGLACCQCAVYVSSTVPLSHRRMCPPFLAGSTRSDFRRVSFSPCLRIGPDVM